MYREARRCGSGTQVGPGSEERRGKVKLDSLERALELKKKGSIVLPAPENPAVVEAYRVEAFRELKNCLSATPA